MDFARGRSASVSFSVIPRQGLRRNNCDLPSVVGRWDLDYSWSGNGGHRTDWEGPEGCHLQLLAGCQRYS